LQVVLLNTCEIQKTSVKFNSDNVAVMKYRYLLLICVVSACFCSCKKDAKAPVPVPGTLILGKWYSTKEVSSLYRDGAQLSTFNKTNFTNDDFVEYYNDGSGYYSKSSTVGPSLSEFTYSIKGTTITEYLSAVNAGVPETISNISSGNLAIHVVSLVSDPNDPSLTDTEIDDLAYTR
jgi:hypothetical protein